MKRKESTSITKKTAIEPVGMMEVKKIPDFPITEPPLYRKDEYFTPAATSAPMVSSLRAQLKKRFMVKRPLQD